MHKYNEEQMKLYNIYHGLGGGFGGAQYDYTDYFASDEAAEQAAYQAAIEDYQSYEGSHGILSYEEIAEEYHEDEGTRYDCLTPEDEETLKARYLEEIESWICYMAISTDDDGLTAAELDFL